MSLKLMAIRFEEQNRQPIAYGSWVMINDCALGKFKVTDQR